MRHGWAFYAAAGLAIAVLASVFAVGFVVGLYRALVKWERWREGGD